MTTGSDVIIVSTPEDVHALAVKREIEGRGGSCAILSNEAFPAAEALTYAWDGTEETRELGAARFAEPRRHSVWLRRFRPYTLDDKLHGEYRDYARRATDSTFEGILCGRARLIVNPAERNRFIDHKALQLQLALECGLPVPSTIITNEPEKALEFLSRHSRVVTKSIASWRFRLIETRFIDSSAIPDFSSIKLCPVLMQEYLAGMIEYRVTIIGMRVFTAKVDLAEAEHPVDGRLHFSRVMEAAELPTDTEARLLRFHRAAGLIYGAYDLRCDASGIPHFLEVNTDGQYLFVEIETGLPISAAMADVLLRRSQ